MNTAINSQSKINNKRSFSWGWFRYVARLVCLHQIRVPILGVVFFVCSLATAATDPWRLQSALDLPDCLELSGSARVRYESLDEQFRTTSGGTGNQILVFRTLLAAQLSFDNWGAVAEFQDSRQELADSGSPLKSSDVNTSELLQAYVKLKAADLLLDGSNAELRLGRQTMDAGSRRLSARNRFRNTLNAFDGASLYWKSPSGPDLQAFYLMPVIRRPSSSTDLLDNEQQQDRSYDDFVFWGLHSTWRDLPVVSTGELYFYGIEEADEGDLATKNRQLYTPGLRVFRKAAKGAWDFDVELVAQFGEQRSGTSSSDEVDLDHWAQFAHLEFGYTQDGSWSPRFAVLFDYASGDEDPDDGESNRFDTLYGARRFEYGPTGIYGAFARSNILSPGIRMKVQPTDRLSTQLTYRAYWLASDTDAWTTSGLRDTSGDTDRFVGQQVEMQVKWDILPGNLSADLGVAYLFAGPFIHDAPNSSGQGDSAYAYSALTFKF
jgi:hypothetical protein